jgi:hypothetical protein
MELTPRLRYPFELGERVRIRDGVKGPPCGTGVVIRIELDKGGCLVHHDEPFDLPVLGTVSIFGWTWDELEPEYLH